MGTPGSGYNVEPWRAFYRAGLFVDTLINTVNAATHGDTEMELDGFPPNHFAPISPNDPAVGKSRRFIFDPADGTGFRQVIEARDMEFDPALVLKLQDPLDFGSGPGGPFAAPIDIGMLLRSPEVLVGNYPKLVEFILTIHAFDDRGNAVSTNPDLSFEIYMAGRRTGPYFLKTGLLPLSIIAPAGGNDSITSETVVLPPLNYLQVEVIPGGTDAGDTVFTLEMVRSEK